VEEHFPAISTTFPNETEANHVKQENGMEGSCWSSNATKTLKANLSVAEESQEQPEEEDEAEESLSTTKCGNVVLTLLLKKESKPRKKPVERKDQSSSMEKSKDLFDPSGADAPREKDKGETQLTKAPPLARSLNMTRLRDRWWELLKNQPLHPEPPLEEESSLGKSNENGGSDDDDLSLVHVGEPPRVDYSYGNQRRQVIDDSYLEHEYPIHEAIRRDDEEALRLLLRTATTTTQDTNEKQSPDMSPLELAVHLHRPNLLRILLQSSSESSQQQTKTRPTLHLAVSLGYEDCVSVFMDASMSSLLLKDQEEENNAIHLACLPNASTTSILPVCIKRMDNATTAKALLQKNRRGQTPLHIACSSCRVDSVQTILQSCSYSLLSKVLSVQDEDKQTPFLAAVASGSLDVVMEMLMWKGNNHKLIRGGSAKGQCALSWAVRARDVEMMLLLLDFSDSSKRGYDVDGALHTAVRMVQKGYATCDEIQLELVRCLINAGASPCSRATSTGETALFIAAEACEDQLIRVIIKSYATFLSTTRTKRRRDPFLQKQPESFFKKIEDQEEGEKLIALREALIFCLFQGRVKESLSVKYYSCAIALYASQVSVDRASMKKLQEAIKVNDKSALSVEVPHNSAVLHEASYLPPSGSQMKKTAFCGSNKSKDAMDPSIFWALQMASSSWGQLDDSLHCRSLRDLKRDHGVSTPPDVVLVSRDGHSFKAHTEIIASKSARMDAAIRFERMKLGSEEGITTLDVPLNSILCKWFLQHCYSGSMLGPMSESDEELCHFLLELLDFSLQYLCSSLAQECEMRLLSFEPRVCHCTQCCHHQPLGHQGIACTYLAPGPSLCIQSETCLHVLAACIEFENTGEGVDYDILLVDDGSLRPSWLSNATNIIPHPALQRLRTTAAIYVVRNFSSVAHTRAFEAQFGDGVAEPMSRQESLLFLLHTCMGMLMSTEAI